MFRTMRVASKALVSRLRQSNLGITFNSRSSLGFRSGRLPSSLVDGLPTGCASLLSRSLSNCMHFPDFPSDTYTSSVHEDV